jgi:hypothetical protein
MATKQQMGIYAPDGSLYITLTDGEGNLINSAGGVVQVDNTAAAGTITADKTIIIYDDTGTAYKVPVVAA